MQSHTVARPPGLLVPTQSNGNTRRRKRARTLAARIRKLIESFPEFRAVLDESLLLVQQQIERNPESDRQIVLAAIHLGAWTIDELLEETRLTRAELQKILDDFLANHVVLRKESQEKNTLGGRPKILWLPAPNHQPQK